MKRNVKFTACVLIPALLLSFVGCSGNTAKNTSSTTKNSASSTPSNTKALKSFSLPYNTVASFNPLLPSSNVNMQLSPLMYDFLAEPDTNYNPQMQLASAVKCTGTTVTVNLKSGVLFTDGTSLSASDVVYSLNFVKGHPNSPYSAKLSNAVSIDGSGLTVTITLKNPDPLFANLLDIPIIKEDSGVSNNAVGTGRYIYSKNGVNAKLTLNKKWYKGATSAFATIPLANIPYSDAVMSSLSIGEINYTYSDSGSGNNAPATNAQNTVVNLNQLVFVGLNTQKVQLSNAHFRRALSLSLNRTLLVSQVFSNRAEPSVLPFNPSWSQLSKPTDKQLISDFTTEAAEMSLASGTGTNTKFTLLVNGDNALRTAAARYVASSFEKTGITVTVKAVPFADYTAAINSGSFDMYLGELKMSNNMDLSPFLAPGGAAAHCAVANSSTLNSFNLWRGGTQNIKSVASTFETETPFIPLCFRTGTTSYSKGLSGVTATDGDIFYNFENWKAN